MQLTKNFDQDATARLNYMKQKVKKHKRLNRRLPQSNNPLNKIKEPLDPIAI